LHGHIAAEGLAFGDVSYFVTQLPVFFGVGNSLSDYGSVAAAGPDHANEHLDRRALAGSVLSKECECARPGCARQDG